MSEVQTPPQEQVAEKPKRRNKVAEEKARLRAELAALANKVPAAVNAGSIQTTRAWVADNTVIAKVADGGRKRLSREKLQELLNAAKGWHTEAAAEA